MNAYVSLFKKRYVFTPRFNHSVPQTQTQTHLLERDRVFDLIRIYAGINEVRTFTCPVHRLIQIGYRLGNNA